MDKFIKSCIDQPVLLFAVIFLVVFILVTFKEPLSHVLKIVLPMFFKKKLGVGNDKKENEIEKEEVELCKISILPQSRLTSDFKASFGLLCDYDSLCLVGDTTHYTQQILSLIDSARSSSLRITFNFVGTAKMDRNFRVAWFAAIENIITKNGVLITFVFAANISGEALALYNHLITVAEQKDYIIIRKDSRRADRLGP